MKDATAGSGEVWGEAREAAGRLRLCLGARAWQGAMGNWAGAGTGSSIDFQDHRPYLPGDDPRHIDWAAYGRTGQAIMKLYREEVSPRVDLLLDVSASMRHREDKRRRLEGLAHFCVESSLALGAAVRVAALSGRECAEVGLEGWRGREGGLPDLPPSLEPPDVERVAVRPGSLRILVSDLLYEGSPEVLLRAMTSRRGRGILLVPYAADEAEPDWEGNVEMVDCESGRTRRQRVDVELSRRYREAYERHVRTWREAARRMDVRMARVETGRGLVEALMREAFGGGVVEPWG